MASKNGMSEAKRAEIRATVVEAVREAGSYMGGMRLLNERKVKTTGRAKTWAGMAVRAVVLKDDPKLAASLVRKPGKPKAENPAKPEVVAVVGDAEESCAVEVVKATKPRRRRSSKPVPSGMPD